jgi:hypothetical protein
MRTRLSASILGSVLLAGATVGATVGAPPASAQVRPVVTLNPTPTHAVRQGFVVTGRLLHAGGRGKVVRIQLQVRGRWAVIARRGAATNGQYRVPLVGKATGRYRIRAQAIFGSRVLAYSPVRIVTIVPAATPPPSRVPSGALSLTSR